MQINSDAGDSISVVRDPQGVRLLILPPSTVQEVPGYDVFSIGLSFPSARKVARALKKGSGVSTVPDKSFEFRCKGGVGEIKVAFQDHPDRFYRIRLSGLNYGNFRSQFVDMLQEQMPTHPPRTTTVFRQGNKTGRNDPCPCGSGRKYKKCCWGRDHKSPIAVEMQFVEKAKNEPTIKEFRSLAYADPGILKHSDYWLHFGQALGSAGYHDQAKHAFERVLELDSSDYTAILNLAVTLEQLGQSEQGLALIETVPYHHTRKSVIKANILFSMERYDEAIPLYEVAIAEEPDFWLPRVKLLTCLRLTKSSAFELWLERAMRALPNSAPIALEYCYHCFHSLKLQELADADWIDGLQSDAGRTDIVGRNEDDPHTILLARMWRLCGIVERDQNPDLLPDILGLLNEASAPSGICDIARVIVGFASNLGQPDLVERAYPFICDICRNDKKKIPDLQACRAKALQTSGNLESAATTCQQILEDNPNNFLVLDTYWWTLDDLGRVDEAIDAANRVWELAPNEPNINYNLGYLYGKCGKQAAARQHYEKQLEKTPDHWRCLENFTLILLLEQEVDEATRLASRAFNIEEEKLVSETVRKAPEVELDDIEDAVATLVKGKMYKFQKLCAFARKSVGSHTYSSDLLAKNNEGEFFFGAETRIDSGAFSVADILSALQDPTSIHAGEVRRHLTMQQRGDHSNIVERLRQDLPGLSALPEEAISALTEGERRMSSDVDHDFAPDIVSFAKSVEITLRELVFERYKTHCQVAIDVQAEVQVAMQDKFRQAQNFVRYLSYGQHMELGTMVKTLELCGGRTARRLKLVGELRDFIEKELNAPDLFSKDNLQKCSELAVLRNNAAHAEPSTRDTAAKARRLALEQLTIFCRSNPPNEGNSS